MAKVRQQRMHIGFESKIQDLYKFCAEGWSITMAENKAGLMRKTSDYEDYKKTEHFERVRKVYGKKQPQFIGANQ